jgi:two-component system CheB/CheR fusion protein
MHGGFTLAQAEFDETAMQGMPTNAAATGLVDHVVAVEAMPAKLIAHQAQLAQSADGGYHMPAARTGNGI